MVTDADGYTEDEKWLVVRGRRWRRTDPALPDALVERLKSHLGRARNAVRAAKTAADDTALRAARERVGVAKQGLGERGEKWWEMPRADRLARAEEALSELDR
ncbi:MULTISPECIES: biopolymer transporter Tol [Brevibacterium]|uniref:Biopolymer transporter Tol n=1 Tax=Brevibacterium casei TaxID=33889 RepID=A0A7T4A2J0_9MICO|nr:MULTISPECIES: biopolymer transporter Tol [Brevibacterium]QQB16049.1 biopolymer transporter Tol [Brevibacterium casei]